MNIKESNCHCGKSSRHTRLAIRKKVKKNLEEGILDTIKRAFGNVRTAMKAPIRDEQGKLTQKGQLMSSLIQGGFRYTAGLGATTKTGALLPVNIPTPQSLATGNVAKSILRMASGTPQNIRDKAKTEPVEKTPSETETNKRLVSVIPQAGSMKGREVQTDVGDIAPANIKNTLKSIQQRSEENRKLLAKLRNQPLPERKGLFGRIKDALLISRQKRQADALKRQENLKSLRSAEERDKDLFRQSNLLLQRGRETGVLPPERPMELDLL